MRNRQTTRKENILSDLSNELKDGFSTLRQKREPTKFECGMLGALGATVVLGFLFWLGVQLSMLNLMVHLG
jgi:hypothetical protein